MAQAGPDPPGPQPSRPPDRRTLPGWPRGLREELAAAYVGLSATLMRTERAAGRFPAPVPLTAGRQVWVRDDLDAWLDQKAGRAVLGTAADWMK